MSLTVTDVKVRFGGVVAVDGVSLEVEPGRILGVIGPNGSGKSTLFNAITGFAPMQAGRVEVDGRDAGHVPAHERVRLGLARTFQTPRFDPLVTVRTAIACGFYPAIGAGLVSSMLRGPRTRRDERAIAEQYETIARRMGLAELSDQPMGELPMGRVRLVEVARAIASRPRYLLLDEPAAGLSVAEQRVLAEAIRIEASSGIGVLLVEHNFPLVRDLADHVVVLNRGSVLAEGPPDRIAESQDVIRVYLGGALERAA